MNNDKKPLVSVICATYNHEKYIRDALEGFIKQKTDFRFEVLIHDDASEDNTASIIREYEKKYPEIIKPIYQTENQYSKGVKISHTYLYPKVQGKYIALCEGDDYWIDDNKLQLQIEFLENNPQFSACVHNTVIHNIEKNKVTIGYTEIDKELEMKNVVFCGGQSFHTSSVVFRRKYIDDNVSFCNSVKGVGDYPLSILLASKGKIHYFGKVMSCYRYGVPGSWTKRISQNNESKKMLIDDEINMLRMANEYTNYQYDALFEDAILLNDYSIHVIRERLIISKKILGIREISIKKRIKIILRICFPVLFEMYRSYS